MLLQVRTDMYRNRPLCASVTCLLLWELNNNTRGQMLSGKKKVNVLIEAGFPDTDRLITFWSAAGSVGFLLI